MRNVLVLAADTYRMIDALRDYADILEAEADLYHASRARTVANTIENAKREGVLVKVEQFDLDAAHSAVIGVMVARRERAEALLAEAEALTTEANRLEVLLDAF